jgi:hypothetical protein
MTDVDLASSDTGTWYLQCVRVKRDHVSVTGYTAPLVLPCPTAWWGNGFRAPNSLIRSDFKQHDTDSNFIMEAVAAVGLASNIFQVIDVMKNIATTIKDIRKSTSGFSTETNRFRSLAQLVRKDISSLLASRSNVDDDLQQCIGTLRSQLDKFIIELDSLRLVEPKSLYQSSKIATKIWWRRERITDYVTTIQQISN